MIGSCLALAGVHLLTGRPGGVRLAVPMLVFAPLLALGILSIKAVAAADGQPLEVAQVVIFAAVTVIGAVLAGLTLDARVLPSESPSRRPIGA